jgi:hypothetical protein
MTFMRQINDANVIKTVNLETNTYDSRYLFHKRAARPTAQDSAGFRMKSESMLDKID